MNSSSAEVKAIYLSPVATKLPALVKQVTAVSGEGLKGDRYCTGQGTWSHWPGGGRQVTLIETEVVTEVEQSHGVSAAQMRRNIVVQGLRLNQLVGFEFRVGEVVLAGVRLCEPCAHLERLTTQGVMAVLEGRGGLRADIVEGGVIRQGDRIVPAGGTGLSK